MTRARSERTSSDEVVTCAAVALAALAAGGCALSASPADGLRFQAPAGWRSSPGIMGFMQFWRPPADDREVLMLFKSPKPLQPNDVFSNAQLHDTLKNVTIERRQSIEICGHQPATYVRGARHRRRSPRRRTRRHGDDEHRRQRAISPCTSVRFEAAPNPSAQAALRELCAKS